MGDALEQPAGPPVVLETPEMPSDVRKDLMEGELMGPLESEAAMDIPGEEPVLEEQCPDNIE